jgi:hypothetical protein
VITLKSIKMPQALATSVKATPVLMKPVNIPSNGSQSTI